LIETVYNNVTFKALCKFDLIVLTIKYTVVKNYQNFVYMLIPCGTRTSLNRCHSEGRWCMQHLPEFKKRTPNTYIFVKKFSKINPDI
jgi:hypothetical protein